MTRDAVPALFDIKNGGFFMQRMAEIMRNLEFILSFSLILGSLY
jgi:hypothetical protein